MVVTGILLLTPSISIVLESKGEYTVSGDAEIKEKIGFCRNGMLFVMIAKTGNLVQNQVNMVKVETNENIFVDIEENEKKKKMKMLNHKIFYFEDEINDPKLNFYKYRGNLQEKKIEFYKYKNFTLNENLFGGKFYSNIDQNYGIGFIEQDGTKDKGVFLDFEKNLEFEFNLPNHEFEKIFRINKFFFIGICKILQSEGALGVAMFKEVYLKGKLEFENIFNIGRSFKTNSILPVVNEKLIIYEEESTTRRLNLSKFIFDEPIKIKQKFRLNLDSFDEFHGVYNVLGSTYFMLISEKSSLKKISFYKVEVDSQITQYTEEITETLTQKFISVSPNFAYSAEKNKLILQTTPTKLSFFELNLSKNCYGMRNGTHCTDCTEANNPNSCSQCALGYILNGSSCRKECLIGYFNISEDRCIRNYSHFLNFEIVDEKYQKSNLALRISLIDNKTSQILDSGLLSHDFESLKKLIMVKIDEEKFQNFSVHFWVDWAGFAYFGINFDEELEEDEIRFNLTIEMDEEIDNTLKINTALQLKIKYLKKNFSVDKIRKINSKIMKSKSEKYSKILKFVITFSKILSLISLISVIFPFHASFFALRFFYVFSLLLIIDFINVDNGVLIELVKEEILDFSTYTEKNDDINNSETHSNGKLTSHKAVIAPNRFYQITIMIFLISFCVKLVSYCLEAEKRRKNFWRIQKRFHTIIGIYFQVFWLFNSLRCVFQRQQLEGLEQWLNFFLGIFYLFAENYEFCKIWIELRYKQKDKNEVVFLTEKELDEYIERIVQVDDKEEEDNGEEEKENNEGITKEQEEAIEEEINGLMLEVLKFPEKEHYNYFVVKNIFFYLLKGKLILLAIIAFQILPTLQIILIFVIEFLYFLSAVIGFFQQEKRTNFWILKIDILYSALFLGYYGLSLYNGISQAVRSSEVSLMQQYFNLIFIFGLYLVGILGMILSSLYVIVEVIRLRKGGKKKIKKVDSKIKFKTKRKQYKSENSKLLIN